MVVCAQGYVLVEDKKRRFFKDVLTRFSGWGTPLCANLEVGSRDFVCHAILTVEVGGQYARRDGVRICS